VRRLNGHIAGMTEVAITRETTATGGRYVGKLAGAEGEAELSFSRPEPSRVIAYHTFTPDSMRGQGIAGALVERLIADARSEGFRIEPQCSYVRAQFDKHPEWADLRA
jgi:uncharacterized protein